MKTYRFAKLASAIMAGLALSIALAPARAEKIDFDQGVDASQVLKDIQRQIPLEPIDNAVVIPALSATKEPDFVVTGAVIGMDLLARMEQSEPYRTAAQYPPLIEDLPPEVRDPLKAEWASISTLWAGLTSEANGLEAEDDRLYARAEALDRNAERLERKAQALKGEIDNFNRQCVGRPLPPDEYQACLRWRDDLQQRIRAHNAEVEQHNNAVNQWRSEVTDLRRRAGTESANGKQKASPWLPRVMGAEGQRLIPFSNAAKKALEDSSRPVLKVEVLNCKSKFYGSAPEFPGKCVNTCMVKQTNLITGEVKTSVEDHSEIVNSAKQCQDKPNTKACFDQKGRKVPCPGEPGCLLGEPCTTRGQIR